MEGPPLGRRALRTAALALLALTLLLGVVMPRLDRFVFYPSRYPEGDWGPRLEVPVRDVDLRARDGTRLHAWLARAEGARATILLLHGNAGNITHRLPLLRPLLRLPASVLLLDYRGYGRSEGTPSEEGVYEDAEAAYDWLRAEGVPAERIVLYGESLGGAVAVETAGRRPVAGLIVQSTFTSIADMARRVVPLPLGWLMPTKMASVRKVGALAVPKLHFHGREDEVVPFAMGQALFSAAAAPKRWVEYPAVGHNDWPGGHEREWAAEVGRFLAEVVR